MTTQNLSTAPPAASSGVLSSEDAVAKIKADVEEYRNRLRDNVPFTVKVEGQEGLKTVIAHAEAAKLPVISEDEFVDLVKDVAQHGFQTRVKLVADPENPEQMQVLLGRHRVAVAAALGVPVPAEMFDGDELQAKAQVISSDIMRRHLTAAQRAVFVVTELLPTIEAEAKARQARGVAVPEGEKVARSTEVASALVGGSVSPRSIDRAKAVVRAPETMAKIRSGEIREVAKAQTAAKKELKSDTATAPSTTSSGTSKRASSSSSSASTGDKPKKPTPTALLKQSGRAAADAYRAIGDQSRRPTDNTVQTWVDLIEEISGSLMAINEVIEAHRSAGAKTS